MDQIPQNRNTPIQGRSAQDPLEQSTLEALSAGVDGELPAHELRFLLRRLDHDARLQHVWSRYHLMREGLRGSLPPLATPGFAARVSASIEHASLPAGGRRRHWLRWSAGGAIAASVAAATLMLGQPANDAERAVAAQTAQQDVSATAAADPARTLANPSVVPPWLSGSSAGLLSQPASATFGSPFAGAPTLQSRPSAVYPSLYRYRALDSNDGSYLLLLDPQSAAESTPRRAAATAQ